MKESVVERERWQREAKDECRNRNVGVIVVVVLSACFQSELHDAIRLAIHPTEPTTPNTCMHAVHITPRSEIEIATTRDGRAERTLPIMDVMRVRSGAVGSSFKKANGGNIKLMQSAVSPPTTEYTFPKLVTTNAIIRAKPKM